MHGVCIQRKYQGGHGQKIWGRDNISFIDVIKGKGSMDSKKEGNNGPFCRLIDFIPKISTKDEVINESLKELRLCIVGKFIDQWLGISILKNWALEKWELKGQVSFSMLPKDFWLSTLIFRRTSNMF